VGRIKVLWLTPFQSIINQLEIKKNRENNMVTENTGEKKKPTSPQNDKHASAALHTDKSNDFVTTDNAHNHSPQENERSGKQIVGHHQISSLYLLDT
jgi:uncharacterized membrane protein YdfJ with MMPL/SSD domain